MRPRAPLPRHRGACSGVAMGRRVIGAAATLAVLVVSGCPLEPYAIPVDCAAFACNDNNPCTLDACDEANAGCTFEPLPFDSVCDLDGDACTGVDRCDGNGSCVVGTPVVLDDDNP
ncbi:MAG: hypothetical protein EXR75_16570 [Myxococcales bacterium]|nr:hypothetical protein [Myxococcales bacterium]